MLSILASGKFKKSVEKLPNDESLKLPPIGDIVIEETNDEEEEAKKKKKQREEEEETFLKPHDFDHWVRTMDAQKKIYYYNTMTAESTWLAPCQICFRTGEKWCLDCKSTYCDKHYAKIHRNEKDGDYESLRKHRWSKNELGNDRETLEQPDDVYCIECNMKVATKLCDICWDAYCTKCFDLVHHVGFLKEHKGINIRRAKMQWYCVRQKEPEPDYYINGVTGDKTYEKPMELMTELEKILMENFNTHKIAAEEHVQQIEQLQFELEKAKYERDQLLLQNAQLMQASRSKGNQPQGQSTVNAKAQDSEYRQMLMNPSDRRRGQARNNQIKQLIEKPFPTGPESNNK
jgi:hypothetical protein